MKLDPKGIRYLTAEDWRVLTAVEMGSKNHEIVPVPLITQISSLRSGTGVHKCISNLAKANLISKIKNAKYDGYRLAYGGLDYLALNAHRKANCIYSVGNQIGVGKESDIFVVASPSGQQRVLKIHRLGRISFRSVKSNRDYLRKRQGGSWMYMSRLAAMKEHAFMKALWDNGFPVPEPVAQNRHTVVMSLVDGFPLRQISSVPDPPALYAELISLAMRLAQYGLIHGDFNEFNIMIEEQPEASNSSPNDTESSKENDDRSPNVRLNPIIIDFPQMVSTSHANAEYYFDRDIACIKKFFERRFKFTSDDPGPTFADAMKQAQRSHNQRRLDVEVEASGFSKKMAKELESYMQEVGVEGDGGGLSVKHDGAVGDATELEGQRDGGEDNEDLGEEDGEGEESDRPASPHLYPALSPMDVMTPLDIHDRQFAFEAAAVGEPALPAKPRATAQAAGWAI
ncbi:serine/threonine protein kinase [Rhizodiscina lignyota]|uniref:Serine/threonine-protein kinase RIO2 n=1 Tax=Rhizodiscina lignyota TaxID=1504668 RepID=A0A9P4IQM2_9PEZI|nr:serine/threonine protein kinase [Rhizodiscina lignyota]